MVLHSLQVDTQIPAIERNEGTSFSRTCFNVLNTLSGVGILSIPFALSQGGWLSLLLLFLVALLCWYTGLLLQRCMELNPQIKTYPDIGQAAYGLKGRMAISIFMYFELYLVAVSFLILEGDNLSMLFPHVSLNIAGHRIGAKKFFVLATALAVLPTTWMRSLGLLALVSAGGVLASIVLVASVLWVGAASIGFQEHGDLLNWKGLPTAISLYLFCYCGHPVFPSFINSMKHKNRFPKLLLVCFITSTIIYGSMAIFGYLMFGESLKSQVTLNLPAHKMSAKIAIWVTVINPLTKYAVIVSPIATAIDNKYFQNSRAKSIVMRTALVISSMCVALMVPFFAYIMAFVGAFLNVTVSILLPCLFYMKIHNVPRGFKFEFMTILGIMIIGTFVGVVGTYSSLKEIVNHL